MKLVCPSCGATASVEAMINDATAREAVLAVAELPSPLHLSTLRYMSLFRPGKSALSWKKVLRLTKEINNLCCTGYVSVQGEVDRNCPPRIWAVAMDTMKEQQTGIKRPLKNHNYLRQVAHGLADAADKTQESEVRHAECAHNRPPNNNERGIDPLDRVRQEWDAKTNDSEEVV